MEPIKLHIGCGRQHLPGFINIDNHATSATDIVTEAWLLRGPPLSCADGSVDEVYTSHMIEHLYPYQLETALTEWHRVLRPKGTLRIRCPNFEVYVREWLEGDYAWRWTWGIINLFGHSNRGPGMHHRTGYTKERLKAVTFAAGFETTSCTIGPTREFTRNTVEYRANGDLMYRGVRTEHPLPEARREYYGSVASFQIQNGLWRG